MNQQSKLNELVCSLITQSSALVEQIRLGDLEQFLRLNQQIQVLLFDFLKLISQALKKPDVFFQFQETYWNTLHSVYETTVLFWAQESPPVLKDTRFNKEEWTESPFFNAIAQQYLLLNKQVNSLLESVESEDSADLKRIKFFISQIMEALSPTNFLQTNPELLHETIQTQGKNLVEGLKHFLNDVEMDSSHLLIRMLEKQEFKIGIDLAATPGKVIYRNEMIELIQYLPQTSEVHSVPLLVVPPWINKYYILDLSPENSFIQWVVKQGITVFAISWINPNSTYAKKGLEDYLQKGPLEALAVIKKQLQINHVHLLGFCIGGTLVACTLAYLKAIQQDLICSATLLASLIDFSDPGDISVFIDKDRILEIERLMKSKGYLDGRIMANTFNLLRPKDLFWSFFVKKYLLGKKLLLIDMLYWNADLTNMPERMLSEYLRWMYLDNQLIKPNEIYLNKIPLDIQQITIPTFFIATKKDHIAPWKSVYLGFAKMQGEKRFLLGDSGHIAGIVNPPANKKYGFYHNLDFNEHPEAWFKNAKYRHGSWWPEWIKWLKVKSDEITPSPNLNTLAFQSLLDAPGSYVHQSYKPS